MTGKVNPELEAEAKSKYQREMMEASEPLQREG